MRACCAEIRQEALAGRATVNVPPDVMVQMTSLSGYRAWLCGERSGTAAVLLHHAQLSPPPLHHALCAAYRHQTRSFWIGNDI